MVGLPGTKTGWDGAPAARERKMGGALLLPPALPGPHPLQDPIAVSGGALTSPPSGDVRCLGGPEPLSRGGAGREETPAAPTMADRCNTSPARHTRKGRGFTAADPPSPRP